MLRKLFDYFVPLDEPNDGDQQQIEIDYGNNQALALTPDTSSGIKQISAELYSIGALDKQGRLHGKGKLMSVSKGFIEGTWKAGVLIELDACQLLIPLDDGSRRIFHILKQESGFLFTCNENFVARVELGLDLSQVFESDTQLDLLDQTLVPFVHVQAVLEDKAYFAIQTAKESLENALLAKSTNTLDDLVAAEDFYQICLLLKVHNTTDALVEGTLRNEFMSEELKKGIREFDEVNASYERRNKLNLMGIKGLPEIVHIQPIVAKFVEEALNNHKNSLRREFPNTPAELIAFMASSLDKIEPRRWLFLDKNDILVFKRLADFDQLHYIKALWTNLIRRMIRISSVNSLATIKPLTNPIFPLIVKVFVETIQKICDEMKMKESQFFELNEDGQLLSRPKIKWPNESSLTVCLDQTYRFLLRLLNHFAPGNYSKRSNFDYEFKMAVEVIQTGYKTVTVDKKVKKSKKAAQIARQNDTNLRVWLCLVDHVYYGLYTFFKDEGKVFSRKLEIRYLEFAGALIQIFANFLEETSNKSHEDCRIVAANFVRLIQKLDIEILKSGFEILEKLLQKIDGMIAEESFIDDFLSIVDVFNIFWEKFKFDNGSLDPFFENRIKNVKDGLQKLLALALSKETSIDAQLQHWRSFIDFFEQVFYLSYGWIVQKEEVPADLPKEILGACTLSSTTNFEVSKPAKFYRFLEEKNLPQPKHFTFEVIGKFGITIHNLLSNDDWNDEEVLDCTNRLYYAMGYSIQIFDVEHQKYSGSGFDRLLKYCTCPFENVVHGADTPDEFEQRIRQMERFYTYSRKLDEMTVDKTIQGFVKEMENFKQIGLVTNIFKERLTASLLKYLEVFNRHMELRNVNEIIKEVKEQCKKLQRQNLNEWTLDDKRTSIPTILAGLSAVWSINISKDLEGIGKYLKPHFNQILAMFRLLSIDSEATGLSNNLAQVNAGEGKSIILGFLAVVFALCGCTVRVASCMKYLALKDLKDFELLFKQFEVEKLVVYVDFDGLAKEMITRRSIEGYQSDLPSLVGEILADGMKTLKNVNDEETKPTKILLLDDADILFSKMYFGNTFNLISKLESASFGRMQLHIWKLTIDGQMNKNEILEEVTKMAENCSQTDNLIRSLLEYAKSLLKIHLNRMIEAADDVNSQKDFKMDDYCLTKDGKITSRGDLSDYRSIFVYFRLNKGQEFDAKSFTNFGCMLVRCGEVSYAKLPLEYSLILGVTGSLSPNANEKDIIKSCEIEQFSSIPTFFERYPNLVLSSLKKDGNCKITKDESSWMKSIFEIIESSIEDRQFIVIFFKTITEIAVFKEKYGKKLPRLNVLSGIEGECEIDRILKEAGISETVTLVTRSMCRLIRVNSNDIRVDSYFGVQVIQTFFSDDVNEEIQIINSSRNVSNRRFKLVLCREHLTNFTADEAKNYDTLVAARRAKAEQKDSGFEQKVAKAEEVHNKTMELLRSLAECTPGQRLKYIRKIEEIDTT